MSEKKERESEGQREILCLWGILSHAWIIKTRAMRSCTENTQKLEGNFLYTVIKITLSLFPFNYIIFQGVASHYCEYDIAYIQWFKNKLILCKLYRHKITVACLFLIHQKTNFQTKSIHTVHTVVLFLNESEF